MDINRKNSMNLYILILIGILYWLVILAMQQSSSKTHPNFRCIPSLQAQALLYVIRSPDTIIQQQTDAYITEIADQKIARQRPDLINFYEVMPAQNNLSRETKEFLYLTKELLKSLSDFKMLASYLMRSVVSAKNLTMVHVLCSLRAEEKNQVGYYYKLII